MGSLVVTQLNRTREFIAVTLLRIMDYWLEWIWDGTGSLYGLVAKRSQGHMVMVYRNGGGTVAG